MFAGFVRSLTALKVASIVRYFFPIDVRAGAARFRRKPAFR
jgi:hypothetical protein